MATRDPHLIATRIIQDAGGELVGRTRLQKVAYLMQLAGFGEELGFEYHHYGPYSEDLARGMEIATAFGQVKEVEKKAEWGGRYSIYALDDPEPPQDVRRAAFIQSAARIGAVELELAATAAFLYVEEGIGRTCSGDPWTETARLKPEKASQGRLERAKAEYRTLLTLDIPKPLPPIA